MLARRSLLKAIGIAPLAARQAVSALDLTSMRGAASFLGAGSMVPEIGAEFVDSAGSPLPSDGNVRGASWLLANGIPDIVKEAMRRDRRVPSGLDPDLAANRSFSLAAKVALQRERNYERTLIETMERQRTNIAMSALRKMGVSLWW